MPDEADDDEMNPYDLWGWVAARILGGFTALAFIIYDGFSVLGWTLAILLFLGLIFAPNYFKMKAASKSDK